MNIFRAIFDFLADDSDSMRLDAVSKRVREQMGDLNYKTIADSKREMRGDMMRLRGDFNKAIKEASDNDKKSRTKQNNGKSVKYNKRTNFHLYEIYNRHRQPCK